MMDNNQHCPCGTKKTFSECCKPYIAGDTFANTPEVLMRSRYSAYATQHYEYIVLTHSQSSAKNMSVTNAIDCSGSQTTVNPISVVDIKKASENTLWCKLDVLSAFELNGKGEVEFVAYYKIADEFFAMHELSRFSNIAGKWLYDDGDMLHRSGIVKPHRNDSCLCGSGKKFKRCCLR